MGLKCATDVDEDLARLGCEVAFANQFTGFVDADLTSNQWQFEALGLSNMTVCADRLGQTEWTTIFYSHLGYRFLGKCLIEETC